MKAVARALGKPVAADAPKLPSELRYLWNAFLSLHRSRGSSGFGPNPIQWSEIEAWCRLVRLPLDPWEVEAIRAVDDAYLNSVAAQD